MDFLPLGSVVTLQNSKNNQKVMIIGRLPLTNQHNEIGYFDYVGCAFPQGKINSQDFFFNNEDIKEINFKGFINDEEKKFEAMINQKISEINYPHFRIEFQNKYFNHKIDNLCY